MPNGEGGLGSILGLLWGTSVCDPFALSLLFYEVDVTLPDVQMDWVRHFGPQAPTISRDINLDISVYMQSVPNLSKLCRWHTLCLLSGLQWTPAFQFSNWFSLGTHIFCLCVLLLFEQSLNRMNMSLHLLCVTSSKGKNLFSNALLCTWSSSPS